MFARRFFGGRYFGARFFGDGEDAPVVDGSYNGARYFGPRYFAPRYFSPVAGAAGGGPTDPNTVAGSATGGTTATITWVDASSDETGFQVQVETPNGAGNWTDCSGATNPTAAGVQTFSATGLSPATEYRPRVRAKGASADSGWAYGAAFDTDNTGGGGGSIPAVLAYSSPLSSRLSMGATLQG